MRLLLRTFACSLGVCLLLTCASFRLYSDPSQVKARLEAALGRFLNAPARVEGCQQAFWGPISMERILIPALPAISERTLLELEQVTIEDPLARRPFRFRRSAEAQATPPTVHASSALLRIEREQPLTGEVGSHRWNFQNLLKTDLVLEHLANTHFQALIDGLDVVFQEVGSAREPLIRTLHLTDAELTRVAADGIRVEAELAEGELWSGGQVELAWTRKGGVRLSGSAEDVSAPEKWLPALPEPAREMWKAFQPVGRFHLEIDRLDIPEGGNLSLRATIRHYDTSARTGRSGFTARHLQGPMLVTEDGVRFGMKHTQTSTTAEMLGITAEVDGELRDGRGAFTFQFAGAPLEQFLSSLWREISAGGPDALGFPRARGVLSGALHIERAKGGEETLGGTFRLRDVEAAAAPFFSGLEGEFHFAHELPLSGTPSGKGKLVVDGIAIGGVGSARGEVRCDWDSGGFRIECSNLEVGARGAGGEPETEEGSLLAKASWSWGNGPSAIELRWLGVEWRSALARIESASGSFKKAGTARGEGALDMTRVTVSGGVLWKEGPPLEFQAGECRMAFDDGGKSRLALTSLRLRGVERSLRAVGDVRLDGGLSLFVFLAEGEGHDLLGRLSEDSSPAEWKEAVKGKYRAFRLTGSLGAPKSREVGPLDPAFARPQ